MYLECSSGVCGKNNRGPLEKKTKSSRNNNFISKSGGKVNRKINNRDETRNVQKGKINKLAGIKGK